MDLQKFGVKLFINKNGGYQSKDFIPIFHSWIQDNLVEEHLLIDVADYSHIQDGPGVMLVSHEGNFSLDQERLQPGIMYMRKINTEGSFIERFNNVLSTTIEAANRLSDNKVNKNINFINNSFRFIANDRLCAENTTENQKLYKKEIDNILSEKYQDIKLEYDDVSSKNERLAFTVRISSKINILEDY